MSVLNRLGRKPILFATLALQTIFTFIQVFSVSWSMFTILMVINGLGQMSNYMAALVLGTYDEQPPIHIHSERQFGVYGDRQYIAASAEMAERRRAAVERERT